MIFDYNAFNHRESVKDFSSFGIALSDEKFPAPIIVSKRLLLIDIKDEINEIEVERFIKGRRPTFYDILMSIREAGEDNSIIGIILRIDKDSQTIIFLQASLETSRFATSSGRVATSPLRNGP